MVYEVSELVKNQDFINTFELYRKGNFFNVLFWAFFNIQVEISDWWQEDEILPITFELNTAKYGIMKTSAYLRIRDSKFLFAFHKRDGYWFRNYKPRVTSEIFELYIKVGTANFKAIKELDDSLRKFKRLSRTSKEIPAYIVPDTKSYRSGLGPVFMDEVLVSVSIENGSALARIAHTNETLDLSNLSRNDIIIYKSL